MRVEGKELYCKIKFIDCGADYTWTICKFEDVGNQILAVETDFTDNDLRTFDRVNPPKILIEAILLDIQEYEEIIKDFDN